MKSRGTDTGMESLIKAMADRQEAMERELSALVAAVKRLEGRLDSQNSARHAEQSCLQDFSAQEIEVEVLDDGASGAASAKKRGVKAEVKAVVAAAAAVAGEMAKTRKTRAMTASQDSRSAWSQQGRVGVVSSHNLR